VTILRPQLTPSGYHESVGELRGLTGLRIVAAAWVVFFHFHFTPLPGVAQVVALVGPLLTAGALGVDLFFVLSGFVIAYTYLDQLGPALRASSAARFVWARACRLWPAYAVVFHVFGLWLAARWYFGSDSEIAFQAVQPELSVGEYAQQLVMVQLWDNPRFDGASWVGSTWSISAEWLAYLLFPVAALGFFRLRTLPAGVLAAGSVLLMAPMAWAYLSTGIPYYDWSWLVRILCGFGGGVLAYLAVRRLCSGGMTASARVRARASALAAGLPVLIAVGLLVGELAGPGRGGAVIALFPLLVGALALADRGPALVLSRPWAVYGGRISYCLYLVHIPMLEVYWLALRTFDALGPHTWLAHLTGLAVVAATFAVAAWAFRLVEEPARGRMRRLVPRLTGLIGRAPAPVADMDPACDHAPGPGFPVVRPASAPLAPAADADTDRLPVVPPAPRPVSPRPEPMCSARGRGPAGPARPSPFPRAREPQLHELGPSVSAGPVLAATVRWDRPRP
jgi:peptidoglycan/LPS O-acetylase OafA/YrhL